MISAKLTTATIHHGRWGWHPCDYATFLKIKELHRLALRDHIATKRHARWAAKLPKNRAWRVRVVEGVYVKDQPEPPASLSTDRAAYLWILAEYRAARRPCATPDAVQALDLPRGWEARLEALETFYGTC